MKEEFMLEALKEASLGASLDEVPVGAVIVYNDEIVARAHNEKEASKNPLLHAELLAIERACLAIGSRYLNECAMYVTLEPCAMCAGAMINSRLGFLYFGAREPKSGCIESLYSLLSDKRFNHTVITEGGILEEECAKLMSDFFKEKRGKR